MNWPEYAEYADSGVVWLGLIPRQWTPCRLKHVVNAITSGTSVNGAEIPAGPNEIGVLKTSCVSLGWFNAEANKTVMEDDLSRVSGPVTAGTLIVNRANTPTLVGSAGYVAESRPNLFLSDKLWQVTFNGALAEFVYYWTGTVTYRAQIAAKCVGASSSMQNLSMTDFENIAIALPPMVEQQAIVAFLDHETAKIDALIAKQEQLIATLREDRDATWAFELDRLAERAPVVRIRRVIESIVDGPFGSSLTSAHYTEAGARVIRLGNIGVNEFRDEDRAYISMDYARDLASHAVDAGDVVVAGLGDERMPLGRAVVVPPIGPAIVKADCFRVRPKPGLTAEYLAWALSAPPTRAQIALLARGATRARLNTSVVCEVKIPIPPIDTQRAAVEQSRARLTQIDTLIAKSTAMIDTLHEYRSALITDAVTGKIDVRGTAGIIANGLAVQGGAK